MYGAGEEQRKEREGQRGRQPYCEEHDNEWAQRPRPNPRRCPTGGRRHRATLTPAIRLLWSAVARAHGLDGAQTATTTYTLTAKKQTDTGIEPTSSCKFTIADQGAEGTVAFQVGSAAHFSVDSTGAKVSELGDEAYDDGSSTVVRVGSLMISAGEDSFGDSFTTDLLRKMVPNLK